MIGIKLILIIFIPSRGVFKVLQYLFWFKMYLCINVRLISSLKRFFLPSFSQTLYLREAQFSSHNAVDPHWALWEELTRLGTGWYN